MVLGQYAMNGWFTLDPVSPLLTNYFLAGSGLLVEQGQPLGPYVNQIVFYDGHATRIRIDGLWDLYWHKNWTPPVARPP